MVKKVHALMFEDMPHVFECGVFVEGGPRVGTFKYTNVTCKACRRRLAKRVKVEHPPRQQRLAPCPCETFFVEMQHKVRDICARCGWRK